MAYFTKDWYITQYSSH